MSTEAQKAAKRLHWKKRMQDPEKRAAYLEYQRKYWRLSVADEVGREAAREKNRANLAKRKARKSAATVNQP